MVKRKDKTFWGVLGIILVVGGGIATIPLALKEYLAGPVVSGLAVVVRVLLIAWAFSN